MVVPQFAQEKRPSFGVGSAHLSSTDQLPVLQATSHVAKGGRPWKRIVVVPPRNPREGRGLARRGRCLS